MRPTISRCGVSPASSASGSSVPSRPDTTGALEVPLLDLSAQWRPLRDEILAAITRVCDSQRFILGTEVESLERELEAMLQARHAIGVSSGTDALLCALMALDIGPGDEVITSTYSFFATAGSIVRLGATPVLVDIDPVTFNVDVAAVRAAVTPRTKAIMPVHLFGQCADMDPLIEIAQGAGVPLVEDAAQAIGSTYKGRQAGTMAPLACFSFFPSKNLGAFGDAGLVTASDDRLAARARLLRNHGAERQYFHRIVGGNFRIDALQAAVLRVKAPHLASWTAGRRRNAERYRACFEAAGLLDRVTLPCESPDGLHIYNQFVIRVPSRDRVKASLAAEGIGSAIYYPVPFHLQECFAGLGYREGAFPHAEAAARDSLALPVFPGLTEAQQSHVVDAIRRALSEPIARRSS
jgi:dTDP-4-amino-4,6-dideoxygalactose transaminase